MLHQIFGKNYSKFISLFLGLLNILLAFFIFFSVYSFSLQDKSFISISTATDYVNLFGPIGSFFSSFLIYYFGFLSYSFALFFFIIGIYLIFKKNEIKT